MKNKKQNKGCLIFYKEDIKKAMGEQCIEDILYNSLPISFIGIKLRY